MAMYRGGVGTKIIADCGTTISTATKREIRYRKPSGERGAWAAAQETTTTISHVTVSGDVNEVGPWQLQAYVETPTWTAYGSVFIIKVLEPI